MTKSTSHARWRDVADDLASAKRHIAASIILFRTGRRDLATPDGYRDVMAFQHAMQAGYTSFETALKRILALLGEALPQEPDRHSVLLRRAAQPLDGDRPAILSPVLARAADELLRFRHVAMHVYDHFDERKAALAVEAAETFIGIVDAEIDAFRSVIDPD